jgi:branched-chain amino acid transport system substrate-binding protein
MPHRPTSLHRILHSLTCLAFLIIALSKPSTADERIKIGILSALTGDSATYGVDSRNGLLFANDYFFAGKYDFVIEDDHCDSAAAVSIAQKFANLDHLKYVAGIGCNSVLMATAPIFDRAGVTVITASATSGDKEHIGDRIFRLFPADQQGAALLLSHIAPKYKTIGIISEQNEYPELMQREFIKRNQALPMPRTVVTVEYVTQTTDFAPYLLKLKQQGAEALFLNPNSEAGFMNLVKALRKLTWQVPVYSVYMPASAVVIEGLGSLLEGQEFANLPLADQALDAQGKKIMQAFEARFGKPLSISVIAPLSIDSLRMLDRAIQQKEKPPYEALKEMKFKGLLGEYSFDSHGAIQGFSFQMQRIHHGKVEAIH